MVRVTVVEKGLSRKDRIWLDWNWLFCCEKTTEEVLHTTASTNFWNLWLQQSNILWIIAVDQDWLQESFYPFTIPDALPPPRPPFHDEIGPSAASGIEWLALSSLLVIVFLKIWNTVLYCSMKRRKCIEYDIYQRPLTNMGIVLHPMLFFYCCYVIGK